MTPIYVIDFRHDPRADRGPGALPRAAELLWERFSAVVEGASAVWGGPRPRVTAVVCHRRPGRRTCPGYARTVPRGLDEIGWTCTACDAAGQITHWRGSASDLSAVAVPGEEAARTEGWHAALVTPQEYRVLLWPDWRFEPVVRRILRAAAPTRPGIRIEAPREAWPRLVEATAHAMRWVQRRHPQRQLREALERFLDATRAWE